MEKKSILDTLTAARFYALMDELDTIMNGPEFNSLTFARRTGLRRMRTYLDHVASGLRMWQTNRFEPHNIETIHKHTRLDRNDD